MVNRACVNWFGVQLERIREFREVLIIINQLFLLFGAGDGKLPHLTDCKLQGQRSR